MNSQTVVTFQLQFKLDLEKNLRIQTYQHRLDKKIAKHVIDNMKKMYHKLAKKAEKTILKWDAGESWSKKK